MLKNRDAKSKQALIDYLNQDTDERFWQAINNFGCRHGLCNRFLLSSKRFNPYPYQDYKDLFHQESDRLFKESDDGN